MAENRKADRVIRPLQASDEPEWRRLWAGYLAFYRQALSREATEATWQALIDPGRPGYRTLTATSADWRCWRLLG